MRQISIPEYSHEKIYKLLESFGVFLIPDFLTASECAALRREMDADAKKQPFTISPFHNAWRHNVSHETYLRVCGKINRVMPRLEKHFGEKLAPRERWVFCSYGPGGYLSKHRDDLEDVNRPELSRLRTVTCVIYFSTEAACAGKGFHQGGSLVLYGLVPDRGGRFYGLSLPAKAGLLVAFRCGLSHEVRPVLSGIRYHVASFLAREII